MRVPFRRPHVAASALTLAVAAGASLAPASAAGERILGAPRAAAPVTFAIHLPLRREAELESLVAQQSSPSSPLYRHFLTPDQFRSSYGPAPETFAAAAAALRAQGFAVERVTSQDLHVRGTAAGVERAFSTRLALVRTSDGRVSMRASGPLRMPAALTAIGAVARGVAAPRLHPITASRRTAKVVAKPSNFVGPYGGYFTSDLKQAYEYPSYTSETGKGRTIGIVISSFVDPGDLQNYFTSEGLVAPQVIDRKVDGGQALPPSENDGGFEATLDVEQSGGMAPGAKVVVYDTPDLSDTSILDAYQAVVDDNVADVVNSSFGECELFYGPAYNGGVDYTSVLKQYAPIFLQGNAQGITFVASSGDSGALGCLDTTFSKFIRGVETPASNRYVTAVGGTNLQTTFNDPSSTRPNQSSYVAENADDDPLLPYDPYGIGINATGGVWGSGGGVSTFYAKPLYQRFVQTNATMRAVPDVSLHMGGCPGGTAYPVVNGVPQCPAFRSYDYEAYAGNFYGVIGTSASSPDVVGLLALEEEKTQFRLGNVNYAAYGLARSAPLLSYPVYRQNIPGDNDIVATPGYNEVLGLGTLHAKDFAFLPYAPSAGDPLTASNP